MPVKNQGLIGARYNPDYSSPTSCTNYNDFMSALPGEASVLNFDNMFGNVVESDDTIDGITFNYLVSITPIVWDTPRFRRSIGL